VEEEEEEGAEGAEEEEEEEEEEGGGARATTSRRGSARAETAASSRTERERVRNQRRAAAPPLQSVGKRRLISPRRRCSCARSLQCSREAGSLADRVRIPRTAVQPVRGSQPRIHRCMREFFCQLEPAPTQTARALSRTCCKTVRSPSPSCAVLASLTQRRTTTAAALSRDDPHVLIAQT